MAYAIFCSIFRSLSSVSSAVHFPVTGPVEIYTLLLCGVWVCVLVIKENIEKVKREVLKVRCLHQCMVCSIMNLSDRYNNYVNYVYIHCA